jgi:linoleoyl-CoA desaturase
MITNTYDGENCSFTADFNKEIAQFEAKMGRSLRGGRAVWIQAVTAMVLYFSPLVLLLSGAVTSFGIALGLGLLGGVGFLMVGTIIMHGANHGTLSTNKKVNQFFSFSMEWLGMNSRNWKVQHNQDHHIHTNTEGLDGDISTGEPILRYSINSKFKSKMISYQHIYFPLVYAITFVAWMFRKDYQYTFQYYHENKFRFSGRKLSLLDIYVRMTLYKLVFFFVWIGLPLLLGTPIGYILTLWFAMVTLAGFIMMPVFQMAHCVENVQQFEPGKIPNSWMIHQLNTTANFKLRNQHLHKIMTAVFGGLNYQVEHHLLFSRVAHTHYQQIREEILQPLLDKHKIDSPTFESFGAAWNAHKKFLQNMGKLGRPITMEFG